MRVAPRGLDESRAVIGANEPLEFTSPRVIRVPLGSKLCRPPFFRDGRLCKIHEEMRK